MDDTASTTEELLAQAAWARRLARRLVADEARTDDLLQQAWVAALRRRSDEVRSSARGWFGGVLRNLAAKQFREGVRREARERAVATFEPQPATADHVAELEAQRLIVDALLRIDEPYRETLVRRWYRDEKPAAIARAMAVPVKTAETRLARGLERLRAELIALRGGEGREWSLALLPLAASAPAKWVVLGSLAGGGLTVGAILKFAAAAVLVVAGTWWATREGEGGDAKGGGRDARVAGSTAGDAASAGATVATRAEDENAGADAAANSSVELLTVHVKGDDGRPLDQLRVQLFEDESEPVRGYGNGGVVRVGSPARASRLLVESVVGRTSGAAPACFDVPAHARELTVTLPRGAVLSGRLVCDGRPPGDRVALTFKPTEPFRALRDLPPAVLKSAGPIVQSAFAYSDDEGRFRIAGLDPDVSGWLCVPHDYSTMPIRRTTIGAYHLIDSVRFERPEEGVTVEIYSPPAIVGRLLDRSGAPRRWSRLVATFDAGTPQEWQHRESGPGEGGRFRVLVPATTMRTVDLQIHDETGCDAALVHVDGPFVGTRDVGEVVVAAARMLRFRIVADTERPEEDVDVLLTGPGGVRRVDSWYGHERAVEISSLFTHARFAARGCIPSGVDLPAAGSATPIEVVLVRAARLDVRVAPPVPVGATPESPAHLNVEIGARGRLLEAAIDDPDLAASILGASIDLETAAEPGWTLATFGGGEASLRGLVAGVPLRVRVRGVTCRLLAERTVVLEPGETRELVIPFDAECRTFATRVVDETGAPVAGASVHVLPCREDDRFGGVGTSTDASGLVRFEEYFEDEVAIEIEKDGFVTLRRSPVRLSGEEAVTWRIERCWPLFVEVFDEAGSPVDPDLVDAVAIAEVGSPEPERFGTVRAEDGSYELLNLPATPVRVHASLGGRDYFADATPRQPRVRVVVPVHGAAEVRYVLPLADHVAHGEFLGAIELDPLDERGATVIVNAILFSPQRSTGKVSFPDVLPGRYEAVLIWRNELGDELRRERTGIAFDVAANARSEVAIER